MPGVDVDNTNAQSLNVREIALRLDRAKFECALWYEHQPDPRLKNVENLKLLRLPERGKTWRILREMLAGYDIVAYMDYSPASYMFVCLPRFARRAKAVLHTEAPTGQLTNPSHQMRRLFEGVRGGCDVYTAITEFVSREFQERTGKPVSYILPVGVETERFTPPAERSNPVPVVLFAGTLIERKGPQLVVDAAVRFPGAKFRLVGSGREGFEEVLRKKIAESGVNNVVLDGPRSQAQMLEIMRQCDIFLLPSRLEGIPKVTLEAAATGLPCVVFRDYETPSVVDGVTGFQVTTTEEMMQALAKLISDPTLRQRMGETARRHMSEFDWDVVSRKWQSAYEEISERKTGASR